MAKKSDAHPTAETQSRRVEKPKSNDGRPQDLGVSALLRLKSSSLLDTCVIYCGDNLEQLAKLPDGPCRTGQYWGETKEKRVFEDRHENTRAYIDYLRPRCAQLARVLKQTGSFYYHCDWHASHVLFGDACMAVLGRFIAADVPAMDPAETESPVGNNLDFSAEELAQIEKLLPG